MTTEAAEAQYLAEHQSAMTGKGYALFNPHDKPIDELPVIYGFNAGGSPGWYRGFVITEDGVVLGTHICSAEGYMLHDLGILEGTREDRHENFREEYPDGYRMDFVPFAEVENHEKLKRALELNEQQAEAEDDV